MKPNIPFFPLLVVLLRNLVPLVGKEEINPAELLEGNMLSVVEGGIASAGSA
jgi:hypothetical protein